MHNHIIMISTCIGICNVTRSAQRHLLHNFELLVKSRYSFNSFACMHKGLHRSLILFSSNCSQKINMSRECSQLWCLQDWGKAWHLGLQLLANQGLQLHRVSCKLPKERRTRSDKDKTQKGYALIVNSYLIPSESFSVAIWSSF